MRKILRALHLRVSPAARKREADCAEALAIRNVREKAAAARQRELQGITLLGDRTLVSKTPQRTRDVPDYSTVGEDTAESIEVVECRHITHDDFKAMFEIHTGTYPAVPGDLTYSEKRETLQQVEPLDPREVEHFMETGKIFGDPDNIEVEEVSGDDAAALLYFSTRNNRE